MVVSEADGPSSVGTTTHIPWHKLSTRYVIVSTNPVKYFSQFALASIDENTMVWITFQMKEGLQIDGKVYHSGDIFSLRLNRFETYQIAHTVDMTGTVVESSSSIAVFSGNDCNILNGQGFWDHLREQLPPTSRLDTTYVVPPHLYSSTHIRITLVEKSNISCNYAEKFTWKSYKRMEYFDIVISSNESCYIESDEPVLVASFGLSSSIKNMGDPSMLNVPVHQYRNYYKIIVPFRYTYNYITIIMNGNINNSLRINGETVNISTILYEKILSNGYYDFNIRIIRLHGGELTMTTLGGEHFGLMCAGMNLVKAYAFSGNSVS